MTEGVAGLLRDKTRPSRIAPLEAEVAAKVVQATLTGAPPGEATHWTAPAMAQAHAHQCEFGAADLASPRLAAAPHAAVQAFE